MSEQKNSFLYIGENGKADWGVPEGYPRKEGVTIEWDGNTEGKLSVMDMFYKVSDAILSDEQIKTGTIKVSDGTEMSISNYWDTIVNTGSVTDDIVYAKFVIFVRKDNVSFDGAVFGTAGVYFTNKNNHYATKFTSETIHPISSEFLPEATVLYTDNTYLYHDVKLTTKVTRSELLSMDLRTVSVYIPSTETSSTSIIMLALMFADYGTNSYASVTVAPGVDNRIYYTAEYNPK